MNTLLGISGALCWLVAVVSIIVGRAGEDNAVPDFAPILLAVGLIAFSAAALLDKVDAVAGNTEKELDKVLAVAVTKRWLGLFAAVMVAGIVVFYVVNDRQAENRKKEQELVAWNRETLEQVIAIERLLQSDADEYTFKLLWLNRDMVELRIDWAPKEADTRALKDALDRIKNRQHAMLVTRAPSL
jgi:hypothetical protein